MVAKLDGSVAAMISLYQFKPAWGLPNVSPFCMKVETYLRMANLPFEVKLGDPRKAPKKKLPFIKDDGAVISDSNVIIEHLKKRHGDKLDEALGPTERALGHVIRRMLEEGTYWSVVYSRWGDDAGFALVEQDMLRPALPPVLRSFLPGVIRGSVRKQLYAQGTGRHAPEEIYALGKADLRALSTLLGDKPYFLGDAPSSVDATAYAFLALPLWSPPGSQLTDEMKSLPNLVSYCERMKARYYA
jgi:glutathione S-transferase